MTEMTNVDTWVCHIDCRVVEQFTKGQTGRKWQLKIDGINVSSDPVISLCDHFADSFEPFICNGLRQSGVYSILNCFLFAEISCRIRER